MRFKSGLRAVAIAAALIPPSGLSLAIAGGFGGGGFGERRPRRRHSRDRPSESAPMRPARVRLAPPGGAAAVGTDMRPAGGGIGAAFSAAAATAAARRSQPAAPRMFSLTITMTSGVGTVVSTAATAFSMATTAIAARPDRSGRPSPPGPAPMTIHTSSISRRLRARRTSMRAARPANRQSGHGPRARSMFHA